MKTDPSCEIYVHIPFCAKKCGYCDFYSVTAGRERQRAYFRELREEIKSFRIPDFPGSEKIRSVFFGGGTPSLMETEELASVMTLLRERFLIEEDAEITLEANPGTLSEEKLRACREMGINRLSLGLQAMDDALLKKIGRIHTREKFLETFRAARDAGFTNISADLLSGLPGAERESFTKGLRELVSLRPEHLSVYSLILEEGTPFYTLYGPEGPLNGELPTEEEDRAMVRLTGEILEDAGYSRYEISNYALPGYESRHNIGYWTGVPYYGFGAAAASCLPVTGAEDLRLSRDRRGEEQVLALRKKNASSLSYREEPPEELEELTRKDLQSEFMILGLRMDRGVSEEEYRARFGASFPGEWREIIEKYRALGALDKDKSRIFLTEYGRDVANRVMGDFLL